MSSEGGKGSRSPSPAPARAPSASPTATESKREASTSAAVSPAVAAPPRRAFEMKPSRQHERVGAKALTTKVTAGGSRKLSSGAHRSQPIMRGSRDAIVTRHRSGSLTESHHDPTGGKHSVYHYSITDDKVYKGRGEQGGVKSIARSHAQIYAAAKGE